MVSILFVANASNVADAGGADGSDDDQVEVTQEQEAATPNMDIGGETEESQSSAGTSSRLTTPLPSTPVSRPTLGRGCNMVQKRCYRRETAGDNTNTRK